MGGHPKKLKNLTKIDSSKKQTNRGFFARLGRKPKVYFLLRPGSSVLVGSKFYAIILDVYKHVQIMIKNHLISYICQY